MQPHKKSLRVVMMAGVVTAWVGLWVMPAGAKRALVEVTGQTQCWDDASPAHVIPCAGTGQDGDIQAGVPFPTPRFRADDNGTVKDNLTGLIWLQQADCFGPRTWIDALEDATTLASGRCGLSDGSVAGAWRLPNVKELQSLIDFGAVNPDAPHHPILALPSGHPFTNVQSNFYWSSTTRVRFPEDAWGVSLRVGITHPDPAQGGASKQETRRVWPVRGGD